MGAFKLNTKSYSYDAPSPKIVYSSINEINEMVKNLPVLRSTVAFDMALHRVLTMDAADCAIHDNRYNLRRLYNIEGSDIISLAKEHSDKITQRLSSEGIKQARQKKAEESAKNIVLLSEKLGIGDLIGEKTALQLGKLISVRKWRKNQHYRNEATKDYVEAVAKTVSFSTSKITEACLVAVDSETGQETPLLPKWPESLQKKYLEMVQETNLETLQRCAKDICHGRDIEGDYIPKPDSFKLTK